MPSPTLSAAWDALMAVPVPPSSMVFPLHSPDKLLELRARWARAPTASWSPPIALIRAYFGDELALYAALVATLITTLAAPAAVGVAAWLVGAGTGVRGIAGLAAVNALWASLALAVWDRRRAALQRAWRAEGAAQARASATAPDPTSSPGGSVWKPAARFLLLTLPVMCVAVAASGGLALGVERLRHVAELELPLLPRDSAALAALAALRAGAPEFAARRHRALLYQEVLLPLTTARYLKGHPAALAALRRAQAGNATLLPPLLARALAPTGASGQPALTSARRLKRALLSLFATTRLLRPPVISPAYAGLQLEDFPLWTLLPTWAWAALRHASAALLVVGVPLLSAVTTRTAAALTAHEVHATPAAAAASLAGKRIALSLATALGGLAYVAFVQRDLPLLVSRLTWTLVAMSTLHDVQTVAVPIATTVASVLWARVIGLRRHRAAGKRVEPPPPQEPPQPVAGDGTSGSGALAAVAAVVHAAAAATRAVVQPRTHGTGLLRVDAHERGSSSLSLRTPTALQALAGAASDDIPTAQLEAAMPRHDATDDVVELLVRFALVACFGGVYPLLPALALLAFVAEAHADALKLTTSMQRPPPSAGMQLAWTWRTAFAAVAYAAVPVNAALAWVAAAPVAGETCRALGWLVVAEHGLLAVKGLLHATVLRLDEPAGSDTGGAEVGGGGGHAGDAEVGAAVAGEMHAGTAAAGAGAGGGSKEVGAKGEAEPARVATAVAATACASR